MFLSFRSINGVKPFRNIVNHIRQNHISVKAFYIAREINITNVQNKVYASIPHTFEQTKSVTVTLDKENGQYVSIFQFGSVVFFNIPDLECSTHLTNIKSAGAFSTFTEELQEKEEYEVVVKHSLDKPSEIRNEHLNVRNLDAFNISIVGTVMAQTVALDYYSGRVNRMIEKFLKMNMKIEESGNISKMDQKQLYKLIAADSTVIATVLTKLGLFEGSEAAWENADYRNTWEGLRKEFEVDLRYKDLSMKLEIVKDNSRFFIEMLHNQKSTKLEWTIIILITVEIFIGLAHLATPFMIQS